MSHPCVPLFLLGEWRSRFGFLFNIVKPLLNDAQRAKINIFRAHEVLSGMREFIDDGQIPREYGGSSPEALGHMPEEQALRVQVLKNLKASGVALAADKEMRNPDGTSTDGTGAQSVTAALPPGADEGLPVPAVPTEAWERWVYTPKPPDANHNSMA